MKKFYKRNLAFLTAIAFSASSGIYMIPVNAYEDTAVFSVEQKTITMAEASNDVVVYMTLDNDTVFNAAAFEFDFNEDDLELLYIDPGSAATAAAASVSANPAVRQAAMASIPTRRSDGIGTGTIVELTFKVKNPKPGAKYPISVTNYNDVVQEIKTGNKNVLTPTFNDGYIEIEGEDNSYDDNAVFSVEQKTIAMDEANNEITVCMSLDNNTIFNAAAFEFDFNEDDLELLYIDPGSATTAAAASVSANPAARQAAMASIPTRRSDGIGTGTIVELTFKVKNPKPGAKYPISVTNYNDVVQEIETGNKTVLTSTFNDGYIEIENNYDTVADFSVEQKTIAMNEADNEITVCMSLDNNTIFNATAFEFDFNSADLELLDIDPGSATTAAAASISANPAVKQAAIAGAPTRRSDGIGPGQIVKLTFLIKNPKPGAKYPISAKNYNDVVQEIKTGNKIVLTPTFNDGYIEIEDTDSGSCGENCSYSFDNKTGILEINGTGDMTDYSTFSDVPWYNYKENIKSVTVENGITSIGDYALYDCSNLEDIYYSGTKSEWNNIKTGNNSLANINIHFSKEETPTETEISFSADKKIVPLNKTEKEVEFNIKLDDKNIKINNAGFNLTYNKDYMVLSGISSADGADIEYFKNTDNGSEFSITSEEGVSGQILTFRFKLTDAQFGDKYPIKIANSGEISGTDADGNELIITPVCNNGYIEITTAVNSGDATCDGIVDVRDITLINQYIVKINDITDEGIANADVIADGVVNLKDLGQIKKYLIKTISEL